MAPSESAVRGLVFAKCSSRFATAVMTENDQRMSRTGTLWSLREQWMFHLLILPTAASFGRKFSIAFFARSGRSVYWSVDAMLVWPMLLCSEG